MKCDVSLIPYWPRKILEYVRNYIIGNLSNLFRWLVCNEYFQILYVYNDHSSKTMNRTEKIANTKIQSENCGSFEINIIFDLLLTHEHMQIVNKIDLNLKKNSDFFFRSSFVSERFSTIWTKKS